MLTISSAVEQIVKQKPILHLALTKKLANLSAVARMIKKEVEEQTKKKVTEGAIIMALKRIVKKLDSKSVPISLFKPFNITVRSHLMEFTYINSPKIGECQKKLLKNVENKKDVFVHLARGMSETTIIASVSMEKTIEEIFRQEKLIAKLTNLSSITIKHPEIIVKTPGSYHAILQVIAWEGLNLVEVTSTYTELTLVFFEKDINQAFSALTNFFNGS